MRQKLAIMFSSVSESPGNEKRTRRTGSNLLVTQNFLGGRCVMSRFDPDALIPVS
jgi:hypothetical protein